MAESNQVGESFHISLSSRSFFFSMKFDILLTFDICHRTQILIQIQIQIHYSAFVLWWRATKLVSPFTFLCHPDHFFFSQWNFIFFNFWYLSQNTNINSNTNTNTLFCLCSMVESNQVGESFHISLSSQSFFFSQWNLIFFKFWYLSRNTNMTSDTNTNT